MSRVFTTFSATNPSMFLDIDRDKARILGIEINSIFQALQTSLGGFYVNDINLFGRTWQVQVQAESEDRSSVEDIYRINVRGEDGQMVPLRSLVEVRIELGPQGLIRYNNTRAATVLGGPAPGVSSGQSLAAMDAVAAKTLPSGYRGSWTDISFQEKRAEGQTPIILGFRAAVCVSLPGRALRELDHTGAGPAVGVGRRGGRLLCYRACRPDAGSVRADRHDRPDRPCGEERHSDRRVRQGAARARPCRCMTQPSKARDCGSGRS